MDPQIEIDTLSTSEDLKAPSPPLTVRKSKLDRPAVHRAHNFSAGSAAMPCAIMEAMKQEFADHEGTGMGIIEMSHRDEGGHVQKSVEATEASVRRLLEVPDDYYVLFMHGGAHAQFSAVPLNLLGDATEADYVVAGFWSQKAAKEAEKYCKVNIVANASESNYTSYPDPSTWMLSDKAEIVHICANETIHGLELFEDAELPEGKILVGDFTSTLFSRPIRIDRYGCIYASAGKNLGPAGVCLVIVRKDLVDSDRAKPWCPSILSYKQHAETRPIGSLYNTPPAFQIQFMRHVLKAYEEEGGLRALQARAFRKAKKITKVLEESNGFYYNPVAPHSRSLMSIPLRICAGGQKESAGQATPEPSTSLEEAFLSMAEARDMHQLRGHPLAGGIRVTNYHGVSETAIDVLCAFMREFYRLHVQREKRNSGGASSSPAVSHQSEEKENTRRAS
uniref:phosphoserine transaminase n=1 Tax=Chromera velia CCMP2878 TaxID=1169474 RepID=A0A0G4FNS0_9ALVE|eukprot:Cvel_17926.t1-p1 / transcript=Cvel_17926.t1 / gene=Cvel_17926 / organism=Chromera_velia_CCMP2878 / gene_product=Phosphoserine aminotransferase, putative / transcript_product=Phosphoserine aminotransferase, putative / location=Cvel_scaffold1457:1193-5761(-) / protein_length=448 / sequence_SO=supercontig / SO=protein_coding / is_pseudo=false